MGLHDALSRIVQLEEALSDANGKLDGITRAHGLLIKQHGQSASDLIKAIVANTNLTDELSRVKEERDDAQRGWKRSIEEVARLRLRVEALERGAPVAPPPPRLTRLVLGALRGALEAVRKS